MKFRQKPITGVWINEFEFGKNVDFPAGHMDEIYTASALRSVYGSGATSAAPVGTPTPMLLVSATGLSCTSKVRTSNLAPGSVREHRDKFAHLCRRQRLALVGDFLRQRNSAASVQIMPSGNGLAAGIGAPVVACPDGRQGRQLEHVPLEYQGLVRPARERYPVARTLIRVRSRALLTYCCDRCRQ